MVALPIRTFRRNSARRSRRAGIAEGPVAPDNGPRLLLVRQERSYRRTDLFERRRALMEQWARFLAGLPCRPADGTTGQASRAVSMEP